MAKLPVWKPPLTLQSLLFWKKQGFSPKKARVFLFAEPLKSFEKRGKTHKKARKIGKRKKQGNRKKQGLEGQGLGLPSLKLECIFQLIQGQNLSVKTVQRQRPKAESFVSLPILFTVLPTRMQCSRSILGDESDHDNGERSAS